MRVRPSAAPLGGRTSPLRCGAATLVAGLLLAGPLPSQQPAPEKGVFTDVVQVTVVNVDVVVTDRQGNPVTDLTKDDFEIREDGKSVPVTNFSIVQAEPSQGAPVAPQRKTESEPMPSESPLSLVILVDNSHVSPGNRNRVFRRLERYLDKAVALKTRIMVASYDQGIHLQRRFTSDPAQVAQALKELEKSATGNVETDYERRNVQREIQRVDLSSTDPSTIEAAARAAFASIQFYASRQWDRTRRMLRTVGSFVDSLAGIPGKKSLVLVSEGVQSRPAETLFYQWEGKFSSFPFARGIVASLQTEIDSRNLTGELRGLVARANVSQVAFYAVNAAVGRNAASISPEEGGFDITALDTPSGGLSSTPALAANRLTDLDDSLTYLADGTGGLFFADREDVGSVIDQARTDAANYYSLGYAPQRPPDEATHKVDVRVKRPGLVVRHVARVREKTQDERLTDLTLSCLLLDQTDNPLGVRIEAGEARKEQKGRFVVPVMIKVPVASLALQHKEGFREGHLSMFVIVQGVDGDLSPPRKVPVPVRIPQDRFREALQQVAGYRLNLLMRKGEQRVAVGVRDDLAAVSSTTSLRVNPGGS